MNADAFRTLLGAALVTGSAAAWMPSAQAQSPDVQLAPSRAVECMTPPPARRGEPEYPFAPWKRGEGGRVLVDLVFNGIDVAPKVEVVDQKGDSSLVTAVQQHVATFRVPCADAADLPVKLRQDYVFLPDKRRVFWTTPVDEADPARARLLDCRMTLDGSKSPDYPNWARRDEVQGNVLVKLRFVAPDKPPQVNVYASSTPMRRLGHQAVLAWTDKLRLPCMQGAVVDALVAFTFRLEGSGPGGFGRMDFLQFLRMAKNLEQPGAVFDTQTMGCPFDLRLTYRQPHFANRVGELGEPMPARRPLLQWLSTLELDLRPNQQDAALGDNATFTVPCIKIDLTPKEKTS